MQGKIIAFSEELLLFHDGIGAILGLSAGADDHLHAERARDLRDGFPDLAVAENAEGLAVHLVLRKGVVGKVFALRPVSALYRFGVAVGVARGEQHQGDGVLRHGVRGVGGRVAQRHAVFFAGGKVHVVVARGEGPDIFQIGQGGDDLPRHFRLVDEDRLSALAGGEHFFFGRAVETGHLAET